MNRDIVLENSISIGYNTSKWSSESFPFNSCLGQFTFLTIFVNSLVYFILFFLGKRKGDDCKIRMIEMTVFNVQCLTSFDIYPMNSISLRF